MRTPLVLAIVAVAHVAAAEPPGMTVPAPQQYTPLSEDDRDVLADGEITSNTKIGAAVLDVMVGYGAGQALEGRWRETGWQLAIGDAAFSTVFVTGLMASALSGGPRCPQTCASGAPHTNTMMIVGLVGLGLIRTAGAIDAVVGANTHNRRVRELRARATKTPYLASTGNGVVAGLDLRF